MTFRAWDLTAGLTPTGSDGGIGDASVNGGSTAYSITTTITVTVTAVNDPPSFIMGADENVLEDSGVAGAHTVVGWATNMLTYPAAPPPLATDEAPPAQNILGFTVTNDNNALFTVQPAIAVNGDLTYTLAANANGVANVTVTLQDDGGTANGGIDTSAPQTFVITVTPVNDPPSFTAGANENVNEDSGVAGAHTAVGWATNILTYPSAPPPLASDEAPPTQNILGFTLTNNSVAVTAGQFIPVADITGGLLVFTPAANQFGSPYATFTFQVQDDGGTANGGVDVDPAPNTFTINVTSVNDAPDGTNTTVTTLEPLPISSRPRTSASPTRTTRRRPAPGRPTTSRPPIRHRPWGSRARRTRSRSTTPIPMASTTTAPAPWRTARR